MLTWQISVSQVMLLIFTARHIPGLTFALYTSSGIASRDAALMNVYACSMSPLINAFQRALTRSATSASFVNGARSLPPPVIEAQPTSDAASNATEQATCRQSHDQPFIPR